MIDIKTFFNSYTESDVPDPLVLRKEKYFESLHQSQSSFCGHAEWSNCLRRRTRDPTVVGCEFETALGHQC